MTHSGALLGIVAVCGIPLLILRHVGGLSIAILVLDIGIWCHLQSIDTLLCAFVIIFCLLILKSIFRSLILAKKINLAGRLLIRLSAASIAEELEVVIQFFDY